MEVVQRRHRNKCRLVATAAFRVPIVTDIDIELTFPAYMKREAETFKGTTGDIVAPQGTQVLLTGKADRLIKEAFMVMGEAKNKFCSQ